MIQSTINYRQGDVILVPFPFTDLSTIKQRPALIISADLFNADSPDTYFSPYSYSLIRPRSVTGNTSIFS